MSLNVDPIDIVVAEEAIAVEVTDAKLKESQMAREVERLESMKARYQKECKRIIDEDGSRFSHLPCLNNRYQLTRLLGKGGLAKFGNVTI